MTQKQTLADRWQWMSEILADAMQLKDRDAREALVRERCGGDAEAERELLSLLAADTLFASTLDESAIASAARAALASDPHDSSAQWHGKRLGAYEIVDTIAVGGMGAVFKAKRVDETYETLVAIKVMREDLSAKAKQNVLSRFRAERQMLATLNHPNITRLLDGGSTPDGLPYFVMEYVDGVPIDRYCEENALPIAERLTKFRDVLSAVHFAHQRLIVHRDLKPSNILVDRNGVVKLLDFGIARLLDPANDATQRDAAAQATTLLALTPAYASPEQVKSETITTASDVYSLGVVLYRLLTGVSPYKSKTTQPMELAREIVETDPAKPSTAIVEAEATVTNRGADDTARAPRRIDVARLKKSLRGDLDNIVLKALRKDPSQRYASAEQFSEDIQRSLNGEPVLAHADSLSYRAKKFVQRNRWSVGFASLAVIGLIAGIVATIYQAKLARDAQVRAEAERARAEKHFADVRQIARETIFELNNDLRQVPGTLEVRSKVLDRAVRYLEELSKGAGHTDAALLMETGSGWVELSNTVGIREEAGAGQLAKSIEYRLTGVRFLANALRAAPTDAAIAAQLVNALRGLGSDLGTVGDMEGSRYWLQRAVETGEIFSIERTETQDVRRQTAMALTLHSFYVGGETATDIHRRADYARRARSMLETLLREELTPRARAIATSGLSDVLGTLAEIAARRPDGSLDGEVLLEWIERSIKLAREIQTADPKNASAQSKLAMAHLNGAVDYKKLARLDKAELHARTALEIFERMAAASNDPGSQALVLFAEAALVETLLDKGSVADRQTISARIELGLARIEKLPAEMKVSINVLRPLTALEGGRSRMFAATAKEEAKSDRERRGLCEQSVSAYSRAFSHASRLGELSGEKATADGFKSIRSAIEYCKSYTTNFPSN
jgi:serine/threonine protein kinase